MIAGHFFHHAATWLHISAGIEQNFFARRRC